MKFLLTDKWLTKLAFCINLATYMQSHLNFSESARFLTRFELDQEVRAVKRLSDLILSKEFWILATTVTVYKSLHTYKMSSTWP